MSTALQTQLVQFYIIAFYLAKQQLLAAGDQVGTLHVIEVPWNLRHVTINEVCILKK